MLKFETGDYVLATKYSDGDPDERWNAGYYQLCKNGVHYVSCKENGIWREIGFKRISKI